MQARTVLKGLPMIMGALLALLTLAAVAPASAPPVSNLQATMRVNEDERVELDLSMVVPVGESGSIEPRVWVAVSPTRYFGTPEIDPTDGEQWWWDNPKVAGPYDTSAYDLEFNTHYKITVFFGLQDISAVDSTEWSSPSTTTAVLHTPIPPPIALTDHSFTPQWTGYGDVFGYSVHLAPGDFLDMQLSDPAATMALYPPGTTQIDDEVDPLAQQHKRTLWGVDGAGFAYGVPVGGATGDYVLTSVGGQWTADWSVTHGSGRFSVAAPTRKIVRNPQSHRLIKYLCRGTVSPAAVGRWCWVRTEIYAKYGGRQRWWAGNGHWDRVDSRGRFTTSFRPSNFFPGDWRKAERWRGTFKCRFSVEPYAGYKGAYSPAYSARWGR